MSVVSLDQLSVLGASPAELVEAAAAASYGAISPFLGIGNSGLPMTPLRAGHPETSAMKQRLAQTGVFINNADGFAPFADSPMEELKDGIDLMAELGAKNVATLISDVDANRAFDNFCTLNVSAQSNGLGLVLEFTPLSKIAALSDALAYVQRTGGGNVGILVDPRLIRGPQLCDGPAAPKYAHNALQERMVLGEGELPVVEFLAALPPGLIVGVEVPLRSLAEQGVGHQERALRLMQATRALMTKAEVARRPKKDLTETDFAIVLEDSGYETKQG
jgi:hypothetical protein